jgi:glucose/arabinose dehydrogenase
MASPLSLSGFPLLRSLSATLLLTAFAAAETHVAFRDYFELAFKRPVAMVELAGHADHYLLVEQPGNVVLVRPSEKGKGWQKSAFVKVEVSGGRFFGDERGLLGLALHPRFKENGKYYLNYTRPGDGATVIAEREADAPRLQDAGKAERVVMEIRQPYPNHNGGTIAFGSDGYLYIGMGDGGSGGDPQNRAQDPKELLGKMLRVDVNRRDAERGYGIPQDNPFAHRKGYRPEIWALGLRNPWKWTFHPETGALWAGDVGQSDREEITLVPRGANLGWRIREGDLCREKDKCATPGLTPPIVSLPRNEAISVTGGEFVTDGPLQGAYVFGDYGKGTVWALRKKGNAWERTQIGRVPDVSAFARDSKGRIFALGLKDGIVRVMDAK